MGKNTVLIFVHASQLSMHNLLRITYDSPIETKIVEKIKQAVESRDLSIFNVMFSAAIFYKFGSEGLAKIATASYDSLDEQNLIYRQLLEFTIQRPMEVLADEGRLSEYTTQVCSIIDRQINKMLIWCSMQVVIPKESVYFSCIKQAVTDFIGYRDIEKFSPIHWAAFEGRLDIVELLVAEVGKILINLENLGILTPLYMVALGSSRSSCKEQFVRTAEFLIKEGSDPRSIALAREIADHYKDLELAKLLDQHLSTSVANARLPVVIEALVPKTDILNWIEHNMPLLFDEGSYYADELIENAVKLASIEILEWLKAHRPELLSRTFTYNQKNIAHIAAQFSPNILIWLEENSFEELILGVDRKQNTIMYYLGLYDQLETMERLDKKYPGLFNQENFVTIVTKHLISKEKDILLLKFLDWIKLYKPEFIDQVPLGKNIAHLAIAHQNFQLLDWVNVNAPKQLFICYQNKYDTIYHSVKTLEWLKTHHYKFLKCKIMAVAIAFDSIETFEWLLSNCPELLAELIQNKKFVDFAATNNRIKTKEWIEKYIQEFAPKVEEEVESSEEQFFCSQFSQPQSQELTLSQVINREKVCSQEKLVAERPGYFCQEIMASIARVKSMLKDASEQKQAKVLILRVQAVYDNQLLNSPVGSQLLMKAYKIGGIKLYDLIFELGSTAETVKDMFKVIEQQGMETLLYRLLGKEVKKQELIIKKEHGENQSLIAHIDQESGEILTSTLQDKPALNLGAGQATKVDSISQMQKLMNFIQLSIDYILPEQENDRVIALRDFAFILLEYLGSGPQTLHPIPKGQDPSDPNDEGGFYSPYHELSSDFSWLQGNSSNQSWSGFE